MPVQIARRTGLSVGRPVGSFCSPCAIHPLAWAAGLRRLSLPPPSQGGRPVSWGAAIASSASRRALGIVWACGWFRRWASARLPSPLRPVCPTSRLADRAEIDPKCCLFQLPSLTQAVGLSHVWLISLARLFSWSRSSPKANNLRRSLGLNKATNRAC